MRVKEHISIIPKFMPRIIRIVRICAAEITVRVRPEQALQLPNVEVAAKVDLSPVDLNIYLLEQDGRRCP
jgi:hypothetical protein